MSNSYQEIFKEEALELLTELESALLELEERPDDEEQIGRVFRAMHTIKGSGAMFGFTDIAAFTHEIETVFDRIRMGRLSVTKDVIDYTLEARDLIRSMLDKDTNPGEAPLDPAIDGLTNQFKRLASEEVTLPPPTCSSEPGASPPLHNNAENTTYRIRFTPSRDIFACGTNPILLLEELRSMGVCEAMAYRDEIPFIEEMDAIACYTSWDIILTTTEDINAIRDVFIFVEDMCQLSIDIIGAEVIADDDNDYKKLGEILVERGDASPEEIREALSEKKLLGEILVEKGLTTAAKIESALAEQQHIKNLKERSKATDDSATSIRVPAGRLDTLVNLVGELVTVQARFSQIASVFGSSELASIAEEVERLTGELRDNTLNIRMLPIGTMFGRFRRLVRDLSQELGKDIELTTEGAETELDKTVIEKLNDPLVHLIRNSVDHGIEAPDERESKGKPRTGKIRLYATHSGGNVMIQIHDDGRGLDKDAIYAKAVEKGIIQPNLSLSDRELFNLVFQAGFSTASRVTNVSGRGVGMDVVKRSIDALRGTIELESSLDEGTTVTMKIPLTLAIVEGLLVRIENDNFVLPLSIVEECVELTKEESAASHGRDFANIRGELVPYIRLRKEFSIDGTPPPIEQIVITGSGAKESRIGFVVDNVIGEHQTVIKNLGKFYKDVNGVSGATILGDGSVALIVDVPKLIVNVEAEQNKSFHEREN